MSLDFIILKSRGHPLSIEEIDQDTSFKRADYRALAERFFAGIVWSEIEGLAAFYDMSFEVRASEISLSVTARGPGNTVEYMDSIAVLGAHEGIVVVDVQGSEILVPIGD